MSEIMEKFLPMGLLRLALRLALKAACEGKVWQCWHHLELL